MLTLSFVTGTEPEKWFHRFNERTKDETLHTFSSDDPLESLLAAQDQLGLAKDQDIPSADLALVRLPDARLDELGDHVHIVQLYAEQPGIAFSKEHTLSLYETVSQEELAGEIINYRWLSGQKLDIAQIRTGLSVAAANVGVVLAPRPILKVLAKKEVVHRGFIGDSPESSIALVWYKDRDCAAIQDFVGIAKGRTANSSRQALPKRSARQKTLDKQKRKAQQSTPRFAKAKNSQIGRRKKKRR
ncbi:LysR family transcriptional regulator [Corynebacterium sp. sy017]|uniref:LysR family transcriptional regulator substrate-binding protein n=1 Tax=unclassified Corynebacterium TaxID=2624378 RepID=UPI001184C3F8|nr:MULTISPECIES: LysR family transcriptional regulator substrate-binding protein [unclassified Corynebacterium]MBP3088910.1 LysR family transcriptional regulator [Corynebacterium sp. sy017]QDZ42290.1 LysR family transcriptional regulator substrate-binding protein [Corynebacterium sp. sy039]TSD91241.1 LysR family transcriptional regulator [Corynebacterium sp. SY003]